MSQKEHWAELSNDQWDKMFGSETYVDKAKEVRDFLNTASKSQIKEWKKQKTVDQLAEFMSLFKTPLELDLWFETIHPKQVRKLNGHFY